MAVTIDKTTIAEDTWEGTARSPKSRLRCIITILISARDTMLIPIQTYIYEKRKG